MSTITPTRYPSAPAINRPGLSYAPAEPYVRRVAPLRPAPVAAAPRPRIRAIITLRNITIVVVAIAAIFVGRLMISVATDANAYAIAEQTRLSQNLALDAQFIQEQLNVLNSPQNLSTVAQKMGMISNPSPAFLRISDGKKWGNGQVGARGVIDRTSIANALVGTLSPTANTQGVAEPKTPSGGAESRQQVIVVTESTTTAIPAPNTH
jgi:hypothetical protein